MPKKSSLYKYLLDGNNVLIVVIVVVIIATLGLILGNTFFSKKSVAPITEDQIMIQKGGNTIIVNKNGLIEYRSGNDVFYKTWDNTRIDYFFNRMQTKAREYLNAGETNPCEGCYAVTLYLDGKLVTVYISDDQDLDDAFNEFPDDDGYVGEDLSDFFDDNEDESGGTGGVTLTNTPTPTGTGQQVSASPTPTSVVSPGQQTNYPPVEAGCSAWSQDIVDKAIISNTLCTVVGE